MGILRKILLAFGVAAGSLTLTGCIGVSVLRTQVAPNGANYQVVAKQGPDDGRGSMFRAAAVCAGESFWRVGPWENVANVSPGTALESRVWCPAGRQVVGTNIERGHP